MGAVLRRSRVQPEHQGARRLLGRAVHRRRRAARAGGAHPGAPRLDAGVGGGRDRHRDPRADAAQRPVRGWHPPQRHHDGVAGVPGATATVRWSGGWRTAPTTPTSAAARPARCHPTRSPSTRRGCASRRPCSTTRCWRRVVDASRTPDERRGDLDAQRGANVLGVSRLAELVRVLDGTERFDEVLDYGERRMRAALDRAARRAVAVRRRARLGRSPAAAADADAASRSPSPSPATR